MKIVLASPRGFCAGVVRAIDIVERATELSEHPVYVRHEVVHNTFVVDQLRKKGVKFVQEMDAVPSGSTIIFSAHGVAPLVYQEAQTLRLNALDATCPLVTKVHREVQQHKKHQREVILIGHAAHPEVLGTMGQYNEGNDIEATPPYKIYLVESKEDAENIAVNYPQQLAVVTQTTLSVEDTREIVDILKRRFHGIVTSRREDICYATQNRQNAVKKLAKICDLVLIVGSPNSSNSNRLCEIAAGRGVTAKLIENAQAIDTTWLQDKNCVGISAGASAPELLVQEAITVLKAYGATEVTELEGVEENITFPLPREVRS